jgi:hypothetical protein
MVKSNITRPDSWQEFHINIRMNYNKTFAPITKFVSVHCILALSTIKNMEIYQLDVKITILNGNLEEEIYVEQPEGFTQRGEHLVCKLHKSLYGLK